MVTKPARNKCVLAYPTPTKTWTHIRYGEHLSFPVTNAHTSGQGVGWKFERSLHALLPLPPHLLPLAYTQGQLALCPWEERRRTYSPRIALPRGQCLCHRTCLAPVVPSAAMSAQPAMPASSRAGLQGKGLCCPLPPPRPQPSATYPFLPYLPLPAIPYTTHYLPTYHTSLIASGWKRKEGFGWGSAATGSHSTRLVVRPIIFRHAGGRRLTLYGSQPLFSPFFMYGVPAPPAAYWHGSLRAATAAVRVPQPAAAYWTGLHPPEGYTLSPISPARPPAAAAF